MVDPLPKSDLVSFNTTLLTLQIFCIVSRSASFPWYTLYPSLRVCQYPYLDSPFRRLVLVVLLEGQPTTKRNHALVDSDLLVRRKLLGKAFTEVVSDEANLAQLVVHRIVTGWHISHHSNAGISLSSGNGCD